MLGAVIVLYFWVLLLLVLWLVDFSKSQLRYYVELFTYGLSLAYRCKEVPRDEFIVDRKKLRRGKLFNECV